MIVPHVLIIEGNTAEVRQRQIAALGYDSGTGYARTLQKIEPSVRYDIVYPTDAEPKLPAGMSLDSYQGVAITGSALNIYDGGAAIERQIALVQAVFAAGIPTFGSCWGLQGWGGRQAGRQWLFARWASLLAPMLRHPPSLFTPHPKHPNPKP